MKIKPFLLLVILSIGISNNPAQAGLFDDDEARKAILELRKKVDEINAAKTDNTVVLEQLKQVDSLREELAKLRGQVELLTNQVNDAERRQKEFYTDLDNRLRKFEPQKAVVDGKEAQIEPTEQKSYDTAIAVLQSGDYAGATNALSTFIKTHPHSAYVPSAQYSLGIAYYAQKNYKSAIATFQALIKAHPNNAKAPDAMLNIASCYSEQKQNAAAKKVLQNLTAQYPDSTAAKTAKDRLSALK